MAKAGIAKSSLVHSTGIPGDAYSLACYRGNESDVIHTAAKRISSRGKKAEQLLVTVVSLHCITNVASYQPKTYVIFHHITS